MSGRCDSPSDERAKHERVILFDSTCNWCNAWLAVTMAHDRGKQYSFAALQSPAAQQVLVSLGLPPDNCDTLVLLEEGRAFTKSTAALRIAKRLSGLFPLLYLFILIPRPIRDALYDYIARRRYRWMGKAERCWVPPLHPAHAGDRDTEPEMQRADHPSR